MSARPDPPVRKPYDLWTRVWATYYRLVVIPLTPWTKARQRRVAARACPSMAGVFRDLDAHCAGGSLTELSCKERLDRGILDDASLTYGELEWSSFIGIVDGLAPRAGETFVELGCGCGQFCFFMNRHHGLKTLGVDKVRCLVGMAAQVAAQQGLDTAVFQEGDFLDLDFSLGNIFYVTSTCFNEDTMGRLAARFSQAPAGARVVSLGRPLRTDTLRLRRRVRCGTSWGRDWAYLYDRLG